MTDKTIQQTDPSISTVPAVSVINEELLDFLEQCPTPYHTADTRADTILSCGAAPRSSLFGSLIPCRQDL